MLVEDRSYSLELSLKSYYCYDLDLICSMQALLEGQAPATRTFENSRQRENSAFWSAWPAIEHPTALELVPVQTKTRNSVDQWDGARLPDNFSCWEDTRFVLNDSV